MTVTRDVKLSDSRGDEIIMIRFLCKIRDVGITVFGYRVVL